MFPRLLRCVLVLAGSLLVTHGADPAAPWRLSRVVEFPDWLEVRGEHRVRYELLDHQFRTRQSGGDQVLALRTSLTAQFKAEPGRVVIEALDARQYLQDAGSTINNTQVNPLDVLQAHIRWDAGNLIPGGTNTVRVGRETLDLGNRRWVARNAYRNTINSFTGIDWLWSADGGGSVRAFYFLPVRRLPEAPAALLDNHLVADTESLDQQFWGLYGELPILPAGIRAEIYYLRLQEEAGYDIRERHLHSPGFRLFRPPAADQWDFELEATYQFGHSRLSSDLRLDPLDHQAHFEHLTVGYTFGLKWQPRLGIRYDYASGDGDPTDGTNGRFDTLFGARRFELGPTGIYGAIARANLSSPEYSIALKPARRLEFSLSHRFLWLAQARDVWVDTGVGDARGTSGTDLGQQLELRLRWELVPGNVRWESGFVRLFNGHFPETAPNATRLGDVNYAFSELTLTF